MLRHSIPANTQYTQPKKITHVNLGNLSEPDANELCEKNDKLEESDYLKDIRDRIIMNFGDCLTPENETLQEGFRLKFKHTVMYMSVYRLNAIGVYAIKVEKQNGQYNVYVADIKSRRARSYSATYIFFRSCPVIYVTLRCMLCFVMLYLCIYLEFVNKPQRYGRFFAR